MNIFKEVRRFLNKLIHIFLKYFVGFILFAHIFSSLGQKKQSTRKVFVFRFG